jgi:26S proteasome regulatory subunit (ATPase 3-interacting protein)
LDYLNKQYRPYSTNDIFQNLHGAIGKTAVNKAIESLSAKGDIITKLFGKMAISVARKVESEVSC